MAGVQIILCFCLCLQLVVGQFGFFPQRGERRIPSPFGIGQNFFPNPSGVRNTLNNLFNFQRYPPNQNDQNRPFYNNQYEQNRPIYNNQYDPNRPIYNNQFDQNRPVINNQYDQNRPINNQYENGQMFNNQYDQNRPDYPYQPNDVRFPNRGGEGIDIPRDNMNFGQPIPTSNPIEPNLEYVEQPNNVPKDEMGYGFQNNGNQNADYVDASNNGNSNINEPTSSPFTNDGQSEDPFSNKNGIPTVPPPQLTTNLPQLTPVPPSESRNNFNFGTQGLFKEPCTTVDGAVGSCLSIVSCEPYVKLLQEAKRNPEAVKVLRKAHCGFDGSNPKVCCPLATIPNNPPPSPPPQTPPPVVTSAPTSAPVTSDVAMGKSLESDFIADFPAPPQCGDSNATFSRVVGGMNAKLGDFPWMALLGYQGRRGAGTRWLCGGSLISQHHVLTAAHCIHLHEEDLYVVRVGELDLESETEGATPQDVLIKNKIKHEGYNPKSFTNDIGLLILQQDVQFTDLIKPICIPTSPELRAKSFEKHNPMIAGWGDTEFRGPSSPHLQVLQLPVVSNEVCAKAYSEYKAQVIDERVLCAGYKKGGRDACQGDSGGPLMQPIYNPQNLTTYFFQIGVVSYGKRCAEPGFPGVYTRVTNFVPWLQQHVLGRS